MRVGKRCVEQIAANKGRKKCLGAKPLNRLVASAGDTEKRTTFTTLK